MLTILHRAPFLYREDAYRDYCWAVDAYSAYQPASFIYLCFEAFRDLAAASGLLLVTAPDSARTETTAGFPMRAERESIAAPPDGYHGLIVRILTAEDARLMRHYLELDRNVICLLPTEWLTLFSRRNEDVEHVRGALAEANLSEFAPLVNAEAYSPSEIWWKEVAIPRGRLFVTCDAFLSDGLFLKSYGMSAKNNELITALLSEFSIANHHLVDVTLRNTISTWPCDEPINTTLDIRNHGPALEEAVLSLALPGTFEPIGGPELALRNLAPHRITSVGFEVIPRVAGTFEFPTLSLTSDGRRVALSYTAPSIEIRPRYAQQLRSHHLRDDVGLHRLRSVLEKVPTLSELERLYELAAVDVAACLNKLRTVAERLTRRLLGRQDLRFAEAISELQAKGLLSKKAIGYLHTIRVLGNAASHPSDEPLTMDDVRIAAFALACVVEELLDRHML